MIEGDGPYPFDWAGFVPHVIHPLRVTIIEALAWIERPLSPRQLQEVFGGQTGLSLISYHVNQLRKTGVLEEVGSRPVRGARETFYFFRNND